MGAFEGDSGGIDRPLMDWLGCGEGKEGSRVAFSLCLRLFKL